MNKKRKNRTNKIAVVLTTAVLGGLGVYFFQTENLARNAYIFQKKQIELASVKRSVFQLRNKASRLLSLENIEKRMKNHKELGFTRVEKIHYALSTAIEAQTAKR